MQITVNGEARAVPEQPSRSLLHVLREELGLTQAKYGCGEGACGACTVLLDADPVRSCVTSLAEVGARSVTTLEGLESDVARLRLSRGFADLAAPQCGYCTPGMLVAATALLRRNAQPDAAEIVAAMDGNVCRCGMYPRILRAIHHAVHEPTLATPTMPGGAEAQSVPDPSRASGMSTVAARPRRPWDLSEPQDRDWFELLGEGLIVTLSAEETERLGARDGRGWSTEGGAWIHVDAYGRIRAFIGKVDVGQDNRTALSRIVAAELATPAVDVDLVMGDTDVCPYDLGTFGSRSMADAGAVLRTVAAGVRRVLIQEAASRWGVTASELRLQDGSVVSRSGPHAASFGELVRASNRLEPATADDGATESEATDADASAFAASAFAAATAGRAVGRFRRAIEPGALEYTSDMARPGMLHGRVLRPPSFGARLRSLDLAAAEAIPGVVALREGDFVGVAAADPLAAGHALEQIRADWEEIEQVTESELEAYLRAHPATAEGWEGGADRSQGDVEGALATAAITLSATYATAYLAHVPLETRVAIAEWEPNGDGPRRLTVWTGTQRPFGVREQLAAALGIDELDVRVIVPPTGGGYGGKHSVEAAVEAARLARAAQRPVKVRWSRQEEFSWAYFRPAAVIDVRSGVSADGQLVAWDFRDLNAGPHGSATPYVVPNQRVAYQPAASPLRQGSYRALAATANTFARESHMDELAERLKVDPLRFRLEHLDDDRLAAAFRAVADAAGWPGAAAATESTTGDGSSTGLGIAGGIEKDGRVATCAQVRVSAAGHVSVTRIVTAYDCGAILDRDNLASQVEGATVMGLGGALFEAVHFAQGRISNGSMSGYRVPRFSDIPEIEVILLDRPDEPSAGAGETPIIAVAPAIANAIFAATGRRLRALPLLDAAGRFPAPAPVPAACQLAGEPWAMRPARLGSVQP